MFNKFSGLGIERAKEQEEILNSIQKEFSVKAITKCAMLACILISHYSFNIVEKLTALHYFIFIDWDHRKITEELQMLGFVDDYYSNYNSYSHISLIRRFCSRPNCEEGPVCSKKRCLPCFPLHKELLFPFSSQSLVPCSLLSHEPPESRGKP